MTVNTHLRTGRGRLIQPAILAIPEWLVSSNGASMADQDRPNVFISYSHDSTAHKDRVLVLADQLRADGIDCDLDRYETSPAEGWPRWMAGRIAWADFVLVICTAT